MVKINFKKAAVLAAAYVTVAALSIGFTVAYLTSRDADVNVFTFGQIKIEQTELQREIVNGTEYSDDLEAFENGKHFYPAVYDSIAMESEPFVWENGYSNQLYADSIENVIDKFVFVENTGKNEAYVRTWFAFEAGDLSFERFEEIMHINCDSERWSWSEWNKTPVEIDGVNYYIILASYCGEDGKCILPTGEMSAPSLLQVFFDNGTTTAEYKSMGDEYNILVRTQAVQTAAFKSAEDAFSTAFGNEHPW